MSVTIDPRRDALIIVDVQNDFTPGGALEVPGGDEVIPVIHALQPYFARIITSRDWHPENHVSFSDDPQMEDKSWPPHCVQNTKGARYHPDLLRPARCYEVLKALDPEKESYSVFDKTGMPARLREMGVERVFVTGLAADVCVKFTTLDALKHGFKTVLVRDATRGIGDVEAAVQEMQDAGAGVVTSDVLGDGEPQFDTWEYPEIIRDWVPGE